MAVTPLPEPVPLVGLLLPDWSQPIAMEHAFQTAMFQSATTLAEERRAVREKPYRLLEGRIQAMNRKQGDRLRIAARRLAEDEQPWPLWQDARRITASVTTGANKVIPCDTRYARFYAGARVWLWDRESAGAVRAELCTVVSLNDTQVVVDEIVNARSAGSMIAPSIDLEMQLEGITEGTTGTLNAATVKLSEKSGASALPLLSGYPASGFNLRSGDPILEVEVDWSLAVERGVRREGYSQLVGRANHVFGFGDAKNVIRFGITLPTRAEAWDVMRFMDSLQGRLRPFWIVAPEERYSIVGSGVGYIDVVPLDDLTLDAPTIQYVAIVEPDGVTQTILQINGHTDNGDTWRLGTATSFTLPSRVTRASDVFHVRLSEDRWREVWLTDTICRIEIEALELIEETTVESVGMPAEF